MTSPVVSLLPPLTGAYLPPAAPQGLTDDEQRMIAGLSTKLAMQSAQMYGDQLYYDGLQRLTNLGVAIPQQLAGVRTVVDWPRITIDPLVQRCVIDGFRLPSDTDEDSELAEHWQANDGDTEAPLCFLDALTVGRGYIIVGSPDVPGDSPLMTVESPFNLAMTWDPRTRQPTAAYQAYEAEGVFRAVLYLPAQTVTMSRVAGSAWSIDGRDKHDFGQVPVTRFTNRARTSDREGRSEITPAIKNTTDSACRTLLGMEIAREFYSVPHRYVLGATESDFQDAEGNAKSAIQMVMSKMLAFERDEEGNAPTVGQFAAFDPSVFTKIIDEGAQLMAAQTGYPPSYFGLTSTANPASADAIRVAMNGLESRAGHVQTQFTVPMNRVQGLIWRFANGGAPLPDEMKRLTTDWIDPATATPAATTDAITKQVQIGAVPPTSDVVLKRLGYSGVERERLEVDRKLDAGASVLAELAQSLQAKEARTDVAVATDITGKPLTAPAGPSAASTSPSDGSGGK